MKKIFCKVIEMLFPAKCSEIRAKKRESRSAQQNAMQTMLAASRALRNSGCTTSDVNNILRGALVHYKRERYDCAIGYCKPHLNGC